MSEIRQSTAYLDRFNRVSENPIQNTIEHPWVTPYVSGAEMQLISEDGGVTGGVTGTTFPTTPNRCAWVGDPYPMSQSAGQLPEVWARAAVSYSFPAGTRMALDDDTGHGYEVLETGGFGIILRLYTGGGSFTDISGSIDTGSIDPSFFTSAGCLQLIRLTATHLELWRTTFSTDDSSWELVLTVPDTTYRDGLYAVLGSTGGEDGWSEFGGGEPPPWAPEFMRRPRNYQGVALA